jgi:hypothetical protein
MLRKIFIFSVLLCIMYVLKVYLKAVNRTTGYKKDIKVFDIRLFTSHYMFGSADVIIRWSTNIYLSLLNYTAKWIHFFTFTSNITI